MTPEDGSVIDCPECDGEGVIPVGHPNDPSGKDRICDECGGRGYIDER